MPRILIPAANGRRAALTFSAWAGSLLMPTPKGSRISTVRTSALCADGVNGYLLASQYAALVSAGGSVTVEAPGETPVAGVRVVRVTITRLSRVRVRHDADGNARTYQLDATWQLAV